MHYDDMNDQAILQVNYDTTIMMLLVRGNK